MNRYLVSVAALALMAAPAFAQHEEHGGGHPGGGPSGGGAPHAAPAAAPAAPAMHAGPPGGGGRPGGAGMIHADRGGFGQHKAPAAPAAGPGAPQAAPQVIRPEHGGFDRGGNRGNAIQNNGRPDFNNDNRPLSGNANVNRAMHDNRAGPGGFRGGPGNGGTHNFSSFRDYHRSFSAPHRFHAPAYSRPAGWYYRRWTFGEILPALFWSQQYWLDDYGDFDLPPPPPGAVWVRNGADALLIDRYSGEIITVEYGVFY